MYNYIFVVEIVTNFIDINYLIMLYRLYIKENRYLIKKKKVMDLFKYNINQIYCENHI